MANCLVTTLKGTVNNQNVFPFGSMKFELGDGGNVSRAIVRVINGATLSIASGTFNLYNSAGTTIVATNVSSYNFSDASNTDYTVEGKGIFYLSNKYDIKLGIMADTDQKVIVDLSTFNYSKYLRTVINSTNAVLKGVCKINTLQEANPLNIYVASSQSTGYFDFTDFEPTKIDYMNITSVYGEVKGNCIRNLDIEKCAHVSPYNVNDTSTLALSLMGCDTIYGTVESFVEACNTTRKGGKVNFYLTGTLCTFHNAVPSNRLIAVFSSSGAVVTDTNDNVLGTWNGSSWNYPNS